ncbi:MAG: transketolase [Clostridia bacterium]|nr:transketolase [Clostridia bacterium]
MVQFVEPQLHELADNCKRMRQWILTTTNKAGSGHPGGSLSAVEVMAVLYMKIMRVDPENPDWDRRDYFFLSKGHAAPVLYAALAERGFFPAEELMTLRQAGSRLHGHPSSECTPGVDISSGSLGQGLSIANGVALAARLKGTEQRAYVLLGDGEIQEGQVWEAAMTSAHYKLDNVCAIVDYNRLQLDGPVDEVKTLGSLRAKWEAFGWNAIEIDGHHLQEIYNSFEKAKEVKGRPTVILAHTVKGKGVSFMENQVGWHGVAPNDEQLEIALKELR